MSGNYPENSQFFKNSLKLHIEPIYNYIINPDPSCLTGIRLFSVSGELVAIAKAAEVKNGVQEKTISKL